MGNVLDKDFEVGHLNDHQRKIALVILNAAFSDPSNHSGGGCRAFHTPDEWAERGEEYGTKSELIVCYDGGDLYYTISSDGCYAIDYEMRAHGSKKSGYDSMERVRKALEGIGYFMEECTNWYSAVYKI